MGKRRLLAAALLALVAAPLSWTGGDRLAEASASAGAEPVYESTDLYVAGTEGYHTFRIPSVLTTRSGTVLAFAEGRRNSASDTGDIDTVLKRSFDGGRTWQPMQVVCDMGTDTCGNPTAVQDEETGRVWLFLTHNYGDDTIEEINNGTSRGVRTVWSAYSDDDGATWSAPANRFAEVQRPDTRWDATGPGIGIQLRHGPAKGRLVIPAIGRNIQSDDHGATWYESGRLPDGLNEATVVELTDGTLMRNDRLSKNQELKRRAVVTSADQGATWSPIAYDPVLIDPICEASIVRYKPADNAAGDRMLLFANPAETGKRTTMTVRISYDDGRTWTVSKTAYRGNAAYSSLTVLPDGNVGLLFEGGMYTAYDKIMFASFNLEWMSTVEPDLDDLVFSEGELSPVFRGDIGEYRLELYRDVEELTVTSVTARGETVVAVNGKPAPAGTATTVALGGLDAISVQAKLGPRVRTYAIRLDRTRERPELKLHWTFEAAGADGAVPDLTGGGHAGLLGAGAEIRAGAGLAGAALYLNGQRASVEIANEEDLHPGAGDFSLSVWVKPEALVQQRHIVYWYGQAGRGLPQWWFAVEKNGAVRMNMSGLPSGSEVGVATPAGLVKAGVWTHLAAVRDGSVNKIYVNGRLAATSVRYDGAQMNVTNAALPPLVGFDKGTVGNRDWYGYMDDFRLYRNALTAGESLKLYEGGGDAVPPATEAAVTPDEPGGANGWYVGDVTVALSATDDRSGVARTEYRLNGGAWTAYEGPIAVAAEGATAIDYRSVDRAGNAEPVRTVTVRIDKTAPAIRVVPDRAVLWPPNGKLVPVAMAVEAEDGASGVASVKLVSIAGSEPDETAVSDAAYGTDDREFRLRAERAGNGAGRTYEIVYEATDNAGLQAVGTAIVAVPHDRSE
ncbi:sialidase family protein [Paenibacillus flagellatus]|uniref:sialidase family protein n=1 Tax=Paenibacillus flagellatus TaxID=2211139 RepID=UPI001B8777E6|nr:sialidase family protein [Paenibacillus flagellatus]